MDGTLPLRINRNIFYAPSIGSNSYLFNWVIYIWLSLKFLTIDISISLAGFIFCYAWPNTVSIVFLIIVETLTVRYNPFPLFGFREHLHITQTEHHLNAHCWMGLHMRNEFFILKERRLRVCRDGQSRPCNKNHHLIKMNMLLLFSLKRLSPILKPLIWCLVWYV